MSFWGIEVKPEKPYPYHSDNVQGRLLVTQATLGPGKSSERCILQCSVGHKNPIYLCSLLPNKSECCPLNLEFKDELVAFSIVGSRSIHLSGFFVSDDGDNLRDDYDFDEGDDGTDSEVGFGSSDEDDDSYEYSDPMGLDDDALYISSPVRNSGVVIEEIEEEKSPDVENSKPERKRKNQKNASDTDKQIVAKCNSSGLPIESEDEDGFPVSTSKNSQRVPSISGIKRSSKETEEDAPKSVSKKKKRKEDPSVLEGRPNSEMAQPISGLETEIKPVELEKKKQKKVNKQKKKDLETETPKNIEISTNEEIPTKSSHDRSNLEGNPTSQMSQPISDFETETKSVDSEKKKLNKKNKRKKKDVERETPKNMEISTNTEDEIQTKSSQVRTFNNGLVIEEKKIGVPDGKRASDGSRVGVRYIGKLKKNGKIFDSNVSGRPFEFRLGIGEVIKGWDVGIKGMRVGDKRKLTIPPSMGYGTKGAGGKIPPNAWLEFDVELLSVR